MNKIFLCFALLLPLFLCESEVADLSFCQISRTLADMQSNFLFDRDLAFLYPGGTSKNQRVTWKIEKGIFYVNHDGKQVFQQKIGQPDGIAITSKSSQIRYSNDDGSAPIWQFPSQQLINERNNNGESIACGMIKTLDNGNVAIKFLLQKGSQFRIVTDWQSNTFFSPCTSETFTSFALSSVLLMGKCLNSDGQSQISLGGTRLVIQNDSNLVIYKNGAYVWDSKALSGNLPARVCLQNDGNLAVYDKSRYLWDAKTANNPLCSILRVEDGRAAIYTVNRSEPARVQKIWVSN